MYISLYKNDTGVTLDAVMVTGPHYRESGVNSNMETHHYFTYHATGWVLSCHGVYSLDLYAGRPHCDMDGASNISVDFSGGDGAATFTILKEKDGNKCKVALTKN